MHPHFPPTFWGGEVHLIVQKYGNILNLTVHLAYIFNFFIVFQLQLIPIFPALLSPTVHIPSSVSLSFLKMQNLAHVHTWKEEAG